MAATTTFLTLYQYAQRRLGNRTDSNAIVVAKEVVNDAIRYLSEDDQEYYRERGYINVPAAYTSGTVTVANGATYCSLSSGGSWSSTYSSWMIRIGSDKVAYEARITSNPARITFGQSATYGYSSQTDATYSLFKYEYALPANFRKLGDILDETFLGALHWVDNINEFETLRLQTYTNSGEISFACMAESKLMLWPYVTAKQVIPLPYYRHPTVMSADTDVVDHPDTGGQLLLIKRAIDYHAALAEDEDAKADKAFERLEVQKARTRKYNQRGKDGILSMGSVAGSIIRETKIVGSDD